MSASSWLEAIADPTRLLMCIEHLERLGSTPGVQGATLASLRTAESLERLSASILGGSWRPRAAMRVTLADQPDRRIAVPTLVDRVVLRSTAQVLTAELDGQLGEHAWAYRPGRSVDDALEVLAEGVGMGRLHYVRTDVESFFDSIDRSMLQAELRGLGVPEDVLALIQRAVTGQVLDAGALVVDERGVLQGSPLSPFLSNVVLRGLDQEISARLPEVTYVRYADDITLLSANREALTVALEAVRGALTSARLRLNPGKTRVGHVAQGLAVLGTTITVDGRVEGARLREAIAARAADCVTTEQLQAMADVLDAMRPHWLRWPLTTIPMLATATLSAGAVPSDEELARARVALSDEPTASWDAHLALLRRWVAGSGRAVDLALVTELRTLLRHPSCDADGVAAMARMVDLPVEEIGAVMARDGAGAVQLIAAGHRRIGRALQALTEHAARPQFAPSEGVAVQLLRLFEGRVDMHHQEVEVRRGTRNWQRLHGPLELEAVREHLRGGMRVGVSPVRPDGTTTIGGVRADVVRSSMSAAWMLAAHDVNGREARAHLADRFGKVSEWARSLLAAAQERGWEPLVEQHGRGFAFWFLMREPVPAMMLRAAMRDLINRASRMPDALTVQVRPHEDAAGPRGGTHLVLPLGVSGGVVAAPPALRDGQFRVVEDVEAHLMAVRRHGKELLLGKTIASGAPLARPPVWDSMGAVAEVAAGAQERRLLEQCAVVRSLVGQALVTGMLDSTERRTVLETSGHLAGLGSDSLVRRVYRQVGLSVAAADRQVARLSPHPIGCARIRERHPDTAVRVGCACVFARHAHEAYDTPLLHVFTAPDLVRLIQRSQRHGVGRRPEARPAAGGGAVKGRAVAPVRGGGSTGHAGRGGANHAAGASGTAGAAAGDAGAARASGGGPGAPAGVKDTDQAGVAVVPEVCPVGDVVVSPGGAARPGAAAGGVGAVDAGVVVEAPVVGVVERVMDRVASLLRGGAGAGGRGAGEAGTPSGAPGGGPAVTVPVVERGGGPAAGEPRPPEGSADGESGAPPLDAESLGVVFAELAESRSRLRAERERVAALEEALERAFAAAGTDRLRLAVGELIRVESGGTVRYLWEP